MAVRVDRMMLGDVPEVMAIERDSFTAPWPASAYRRELVENRMAHYYVLRLDPPPIPVVVRPELVATGRRGFLNALLPRALRHDTLPQQVTLAGYAGLWLMVDEAHVTTLGVRPQYRGRGYGELLLVTLIEAALDIHARWLTLEVRVTNEHAQSLYRKYGFKGQGTRKRYYSDNNEDALIMWTDEMFSQDFLQRYRRQKALLLERLQGTGDVLAHETP
jgi:ribosomal-protein-alanine N-acetyltransferase